MKKEMIKEQTDKHKEIETLVAEGEFYRLVSPFEGNTCAWQLVSKDKAKSYVVFARVNAVPNYKPEYLQVKGLDEEATYEVKQLDTRVKGSTLMNAGLPIFLGREDYRTVTFDIEKV